VYDMSIATVASVDVRSWSIVCFILCKSRT